MAPLRWGIASAGKIANDFCMSLTTLPAEDHKVVAVAARSVESAKTFAELFSIPKFYGGYENLATDPEIDVVYIGTINTNHLEIGLMMLDGGKHVLCEKPLTLNEKQSRQLLEHAKAKNLLCVEAIWSRFFPSYQFLKTRLDNKDLGEIKEVNVEFGFNLDWLERLSLKKLGGGTTLDLGVYAIQISQFFFRSEPTSITATGKLNDDGVDVETEVELKYANGGVAKYKTSCLQEQKNVAVITGSKHSMTIPQFWSSTFLTDIDGSVKTWPLPEPTVGKFVFNNSAGLRYEAEDMRKCINEGLLECPTVPHKESLTIARIQDEIRRQIGVKFAADD